MAIMQNSSSQSRYTNRILVIGVILSLLAASTFIPATASAASARQGRNGAYSAQNNRDLRSGFSAGKDCIGISEPLSASITNPPSSGETVTHLNYTSAFDPDRLHPGKYIYYSDKMPRKDFRQICLLLDLPPPLFSDFA